MAEFDPLDASKPVSNKQLAEASNKMHTCLHNVGIRVDGVEKLIQSMALDVARIQGALGIRQPSDAAMSAGVPPTKVSRKLAGITIWQALGALGGLQIFFQWVLPAMIQAMPSWLDGMSTFITSLMAH